MNSRVKQLSDRRGAGRVRPEAATAVAGEGKKIEECRALIDQEAIRLLRAYPYPSKDLQDASHYSFSSGGHRWRPILFLRVYGKLAAGRDLGAVIKLACSIELVHTASIMLDDLPEMDNAQVRRGKKTCHLEFGPAVAVMASLWLCDVAQHVVHGFQSARPPKPGCDLEEHIRFARSQMMLGQVRDLQATCTGEEEILEVYRLKSGVLYGLAAAAPAYLLGLARQAELLQRFGHFLGIAYQISDDIADMTASARELGKDVGRDVARKTIPRLFGERRAVELRDTYKQSAISELKHLDRPIGDLIELVQRITCCG